MFKEDSFKHVVIVDNKGRVIYFTENNLPVYDLKKDEIMGNSIGRVYMNLNESNSSLIGAVTSGVTASNLKQGLETKKRKIVNQVGNTYPLIENNKIIGAIEFSNIISEKIIRQSDIGGNNFLPYKTNGTRYALDDIITRNKDMIDLKNKIIRVARTNSNIMIYGKTGTGKELVAQSIHNESPRRDGPFISQNCGAMPSNLIEGILFGTEVGGFTDAKDKPGLFELANGGTLFLDEINSLDMEGQVKLLKALEERRVKRVGGLKEIPIDVRIVVATNEDPNKLLDESIMRSDLYYRLSVVQLRIPELRERKEDIEYLANYFIDQYNDEFNLNIAYIDKELLSIFKAYSWPGNVRELKNVIESGFNLVEGNKLTLNDVPESIVKYQPREKNFNGLKDYLDSSEKKIILSAYEANEKRLTATANYLKISKQLLRYKLDKYKEK